MSDYYSISSKSNCPFLHRIEQSAETQDVKSSYNVVETEKPKELTQEDKNQQELFCCNQELQRINWEIANLKNKLSKAGIDTEGKFFERCVARIKANAKENRNSFGINNNVPHISTAQPLFPNEKENAGSILQLYNLRQSKIKVQQRIEELEKLVNPDTKK